MGRRAVVVALFVASLAPLAPATAPLHADPPDLVIAEFMASNTTTLLDDDGAPSDWIELWNRSSEPVDLAGWQLSDNGSTWTFPSVVIAADARLVVWASNKAATYPLHTNFALGTGGDTITLRDPDATVVSQYSPNYPPQFADVSYGLGSNSVVGYLATPTPGLPNSPAGTAADKPVLSAEGGYIAAPFELTIATATVDATLRYTTDGSTPTATHGTTYTGPLTVATTTTLRVVAVRSGLLDSQVASATFLVMAEVLAQSGTPPGWPAAAVNEQVFSYGFDPAAVAAHGDAIETSLLAAPTLSILTDQANLTDPATGIYVNPSQSGSAWERPASVELIDGDDGFQLNGGVRLKGGYSRRPGNPKHSLRLYFEPKYEGALDHPLFGDSGVQSFRSIDLRAEQNHSWQSGSARNTMLRDVWFRDSHEAMGDPSTRSRWVHLFLNGQYWGVYMLKDRVSDDHLSEIYGDAPDDYDVIKHADDFTYDVNDGDDTEWLQLWDTVADGEIDDDEFATIDELVDLDNLADYWLLNAVSGNIDGTPSRFLADRLGNNWYAVGGNGQPFRFYVDDGEHTLAPDHDLAVSRVGPFLVGADNAEWRAAAFNPGWLHEVLLTRPEYRAAVRVRARLHLGDAGALGADASTARWLARRDEVDPLVDAEAARWGNFTGQQLGRTEWEQEVAWVRDVWFPARLALVRAQLAVLGLWVADIALADGGYQRAVRLDVPD